MTQKFCKFNASFRLNALSVANALGLVDATTKVQAERGTLCFYDPRTDAKYMMYETGYVRRSKWGNIYQLNKIKRNGIHQVRILANPLEQLGIFAKAVVNYRHTRERNAILIEETFYKQKLI